LLPTVDISGTVLCLRQAYTDGRQGKKQISVLGTMFIFLPVCSSIPSVSFRYLFHLETAILKTVRLLLISSGQLISFNYNFNLKAGVKI